ncbi:hypothetical protein [Kocuria sp. BT304]|uniref:hypothetical protein n=1 Tax=Kocuria sp. BT304 TaxID=1702043 RepID=UPI000DD32C23|nr:hypothetical protein [Kocuria sp. BT304]
MALTVSPCGNRKTWDARVRVTGGHPELLWGIGEAEALTGERVGVERVAVDRDEQTVGYGQLLVHAEDRHTVVDAKSLHVKNPRELVAVLAALQDHARDAHGAAVLRVSPDTHATVELAAQLEAAGYRRRDRPRRGEAGPRHLLVRLGETEGELSKRLSSETLQRCRAGLRDSGVRVRRVNASDRDLSHVGLRTQHIRELLRAVGENSVFLVATETPDEGAETALGYLWFVHTGESAMIYRSGFTDRARQLGVDDALLLTGLVQLQQRQVHKVLAGDPDQPGQPMVLRELATEDHEVLGTWEYPLVGEFQVAGRAEKARHRFLGRRARSAAPEELLPVSRASRRSRRRRTTTPQGPAVPPVAGGVPVAAAADVAAHEHPVQPTGTQAAEPVGTGSGHARGTALTEASVDRATDPGPAGDGRSAASRAAAGGEDGRPAAAPGEQGPENREHKSLATVTPIASAVDADPDLVRHDDTAGTSGRPGEGRDEARERRSRTPFRRQARGRRGAQAAEPDGTTGQASPLDSASEPQHRDGAPDDAARARGEHPSVALLRRAVAEGRAAVRDAARW